MNREIKFRAWDFRRKLMYALDSISFQGDGKIVGGLTHFHPQTYISGGDINNWEFMQFTGLKYKNGKEIYEGDIIKEYNEISLVKFGEATLEGSIDDFDFNGFYLEQKKYIPSKCVYPNNYPLIHKKAQCIEVIGNIWENPELLKV